MANEKSYIVLVTALDNTNIVFNISQLFMVENVQHEGIQTTKIFLKHLIINPNTQQPELFGFLVKGTVKEIYNKIDDVLRDS